ncbi:MAG: diguanylate cyclase/phosphodiesterase [Bradyrhizobium sp.]|nr:diguanylate cyclase/phosphodiesterase [Bradyrhizobium sp.]
MRGPGQKSIDINGRTLRKTVDAVALLVALAIALSTPLIYGLVAYQYEARTASFLAKLNADRVARYVYEHGATWPYQKVRLSELIETKDSSGDGANRILDRAGKAIVAEAELPARFQFTRSSAIVVAGVTVGSIEHVAPLDSLLSRLSLVALFSLLLGFCTYLAVRIFPLRVLDRTLIHLAGANRTIHQKNADLEKQYCALLEREAALRSTEAILQHRSDQLVEAQLLGKIGDWSYRFGESTIAWAPELYELLGYDAESFGCSHAAVMAAYVGDSAQRVLESQAAVIRTGEPKGVDVKFRRGDSSIGDFVVKSKVLKNEKGLTVGFSGTVQDISDRKAAEEQLEKLAYYDPLTGLANRALFRREINDVLTRWGRTGSPAALLLLDLDRFKEVNDSLGHAAGDELLGKVAHLISRKLENNHFLARLGGDEFAIIVPELTDRSAVQKLAMEVIAAISSPIMLERGEVNIGTSIGIATMPRDGTTLNDLLRNADLALYRAKEEGRGRFKFFEPDMSVAAQSKMTMARDLRRAVSENTGLAVHYQPQVDLSTGRVMGYEALMRWTHPTLGNVPPAEFIPVAESSQLICDIGLWILREAAVQAKAWLDAGEAPREIAVNVSAAQIWHTDFVYDVLSVLEDTGLPPHLLCLELTESLLADHAEGRVRIVLTELKRLGVTLALDDFGTDYSSLGYLTQLPFDKLKIDRIFIDGIAESERARKLLQGIIALGRGLNMTIVAEGAEKPEEVEILRDFSCDIVQGYVFARPTLAAEALAFAQQVDRAASGASAIPIPGLNEDAGLPRRAVA